VAAPGGLRAVPVTAYRLPPPAPGRVDHVSAIVNPRAWDASVRALDIGRGLDGVGMLDSSGHGAAPPARPPNVGNAAGEGGAPK
jgi:hypothetical protein